MRENYIPKLSREREEGEGGEWGGGERERDCEVIKRKEMCVEMNKARER